MVSTLSVELVSVQFLANGMDVILAIIHDLSV